MNHTFCFNCGSKLEYNLAKPNFCTNCGTSLKNGVAAASAPIQAKSVSIRKSSQAISEDETDAEYVPDIGKIQVETEIYGGAFTIGSLAGQDTKPTFKAKSKYSIDEFLG